MSGLFFDQDWFDERLKASGQTRGALAQAAGMSVDEVEMVFRDQRELGESEVVAFARILAAAPEEVASRSGAADFGPGGPPIESGNGGSGAGMSAGGLSGAAQRLDQGPRPELLMTREAVTGLHERMDRIERLLELVITKMDKLPGR